MPQPSPWTKDEDAKLLACVEQYANHWVMVQWSMWTSGGTMPRRSSSAYQRRYQRLMTRRRQQKAAYRRRRQSGLPS